MEVLEGEHLPRGLRNNNLGNMRPRPADVSAFDAEGKLIGELPDTVWDGVVGLDVGPSGPYLIFGRVESSVRAIGKQLMHYQSRGMNTIEQIINTWAPPEDNNPTPAYVRAIEGRLGIVPNAQISTRDPKTLFELIQGIIVEENGTVVFSHVSTQQIQTGVDLALGITKE